MSDQVKANRVILNIGMNPNGPRPEPDLPMVSVDGVGLEHVQRVVIEASATGYTTLSLVMCCEIGGFIGTYNVSAALNKGEKDD